MNDGSYDPKASAQQINDEIMRQVGVSHKQLVDIVQNSDYVVYHKEKVPKATPQPVEQQAPKNEFNSLEQEYQEKIREANLEMRKQRGDYEDADNLSKKEEDEYEIKPVDVE